MTPRKKTAKRRKPTPPPVTEAREPQRVSSARRLKDTRTLREVGGTVAEEPGSSARTAEQPPTRGDAAFVREIGTHEAEALARVAHEANRAYCLFLGDSGQPRWEAVDPSIRAGIIRGVQNIASGIVTRPDESHQRWYDDRLSQGWTLGKVRDVTAKTHPNLVPFAELPHEQQTKDHLFFAIVSTLLTRLPRLVQQ